MKTVLYKKRISTCSKTNEKYSNERDWPMKKCFYLFIILYSQKLLHVFKSIYSLWSIPHSPKCQNALANGVDNPNVENSPVFPHKRVRQSRPYETRGVAAKLVNVVDGGAHVLCSLNINQGDPNFTAWLLSYLSRVNPLEQMYQVHCENGQQIRQHQNLSRINI